MKKGKLFKRGISHVLSVLMILTALCASLAVFDGVKAEEVYASSITDVQPGDFILLGTTNDKYTGYPYWRVLDKSDSNGNPLVVSEYAWMGGESNKVSKLKYDSEGGNTWESSDAALWCEDFYTNVLGSKYAAGQSISDDAEKVGYYDYGAFSSQYSNVFFLSAGEANTLLDSSTRIAKTRTGDTIGNAQEWWLRSPFQTDKAGYVMANGTISAKVTTTEYVARPAFYLDLSSISCASKDAGTSEWTVYDNHNWGDPEWSWTGNDAEGYTAASAEFTCGNDSSHTESVNATVNSSTEGNVTTYTATATIDGSEYTDTKTVTASTSEWELSDFTYSNGALTGLSDSGKEKIKENPIVTLPNDSSISTINMFFGGSTKSKANQNITEVIIPDNYTSMADNAFKNCANLKSVTIGRGLETISKGAFQSTGITALTIPGTVKTIETSSFATNTLSSLTLNDGLQTINANAFTSDKIHTVSLPSTVSTLDVSAFGNRIDKSKRTVIVPSEGAEYGEGVVKTGKGHIFNGYVIDITLNENGGEKLDTTSVKADKTDKLWAFASLPTPTYNGKAFTGWYTAAEGGELVTADTKFDEACTIYAHWTDSYTVAFNVNGEGATVDPSSAKTDKDGKVSLPTPNRAGYIFTGWYTDAESGEEVDANKVYEGDTTLFAHWDEPYTITFDPGYDEATVSPNTAKVDETGKLSSLPTPETKDDEMIFVGWYLYDETTEKDVKVSTDTVFNEDKIVYGSWTTKHWSTGDFTYGEWDFTDDLYIDGEAWKGKLWVITGLTDDGEAKLKSGITEIVIPETDNNDKTIQGIGNSALNNKGITNVILPEGIMSGNRGDFFIGASAFYSNNIEKLYLPEGVVYIGNSAFRRNNKLNSVSFPKTVMTVAAGAFANNSSLTTVQFPEIGSSLGIGNTAFGACNLKSVQLPKTTVMVGKGAFTNNPTIVDVYIDGKGAGGNIMEDTSVSHRIINGVLINKVTLNANGGTAEPETIDIKYGKITDYLPHPEKDGSAFLGWFDAEEGGKKVSDEDIFPAEDITLYAYWSDDENLIDAQNKLIEAWDASYDAEQASEAAKKAANPAGQAAVDAAKKAQAAAQAAVDKAKAAKAAADKAVAAMEEAGKDENDPELKAAKEAAEMSGYVVEDSQNMLNNANAAVDSAVKAKADADKKAGEAKKEADRQGVYNAKLPKVKISKPKAAKKAVTVKWKKLSKKNQKKAQKIEVWVCPNKKFAAADTKMKTVSKKKASVKIKGLGKKKTYYVKVRSIKTVNGVKNVGKWSKVKKVKTK